MKKTLLLALLFTASIASFADTKPEKSYSHDVNLSDSIVNSTLLSTDANTTDTEGIYEDGEYRWGAYMLAGVTSHTPFINALGTGAGIHIGGGIFIKRHMIGGEVDMTMGGGIHDNIYTTDGVIDKYDCLVPNGMNLRYGYRVFRSRKVDITPFLGVGGNYYKFKCYDYTDMDNIKKSHICTKGVSLGFGCAFDYVFLRNRDAKYDESHRITIRPYLNYTHHNKGLGWVPALNIAINYSFNSFHLKYLHY